MKHKRIESLLRKYVLPELSGWDCKGKLLFKGPIGFNYIGFELDPSQWDKEKIANVYFQYKATGMEDERYLSARQLIHVDRLSQRYMREGDEPGFARDLLTAIRKWRDVVERILETPRTVIARRTEFPMRMMPGEEYFAVNYLLIGDLENACASYDAKIADTEANNQDGFFEYRLRGLRGIRSAIDEGLDAAWQRLREKENAFAEYHRLVKWIDAEKWSRLPA